ncbi:uncharacterized protein HMPREF1541_01104 [Cyphellophora europaea CBS 101466]|uniref:Zn(2)-C6 fungal-type domain-containing protein n=1 Tax=Cyphellophora europaea (strain CBS 101466) TaxID=1220924 RepID=W2SE81_CYPE1|nr:uncharacterized protein HMPREF1541_01104 [Cyphellophora europaea CBS 101466]ETN46915.1 hypothetical protein HMPREF1541_01104 [Cyphellophora europaea CBS 101466]
MPSRRSHTKSHHGCRQCKARRVKCDETAPQCQRCVKRHITCSFVTDGTDGFVQSATPAPLPTAPQVDHLAPKDGPTNGYHNVEVPLHRFDMPQPSQPQQPSLASSISPAPPPAKVLDLLDLELIHQYCTRTYLSISSRLATHVIWRDAVFREGLRHEFVLRGIMATAALHRASTHPVYSDEYRKYANAALIHQHAALQEYSPLTASPTADNAVALFSLSMLLTVITFAVERLPDDLKTGGPYLTLAETNPDIYLPLGSPTRNFIGVIVTLRGILVVIRQTNQYLQGDIAEMLRYPKIEDLPVHPPEISRMYEDLAETASSYRPHTIKTELSVDELCELFFKQVIRLRDVTRCRGVVEWDNHIFSFLVGSPPEFINCIKQGDPMALVILAHWAACFRCMDHHWWAVGWGEQLVLDIASLVDMGAWSKVMEWPLLQCGRSVSDPGFAQPWNAP